MSSIEQKEHILVCVSASPTNAKIIKTAAKMIHSEDTVFTALYVETPDNSKMSEKDKNRLQENTKLAQKLGAAVEIAYGENIAFQIAEFARLSGVTKVVVGRDAVYPRKVHFKASLVDSLIQNAPNLDIYIIPNVENSISEKEKWFHSKLELSFRDIGISLIILLAVTGLGLLFQTFGFTEANIITVYILGALLISVLTNSRGISLVISILSVILFNFLFTEPRYTLQAYEQGYPVTFVVMFAATFITGTLAMKLKDSARQSARAAYRIKILFDANQEFSKVHGTTEIVNVMAKQLLRLFDRDVIFYMAEGKTLLQPTLYKVEDGSTQQIEPSPREREVAQWTCENNKHAGATTVNYPDAAYLYYAVRMNEKVYGVVGLAMEHQSLEAFESSIFLSILGECALALENEKNAREKEEAALVAQKEQFRANMLRSVSHDLRTPLTSISGNAGILLSSEQNLRPEKKRELYQYIYDDSMWLIKLVENLLSITKIEDGNMGMRMNPELVDEIAAEALTHIDRHSEEHRIQNHIRDELIIVSVDARLIVQVFINLIDNAIKYTQKGSVIELRAKAADHWVTIEVADDGQGISDEEKERVFEMFYTQGTKLSDGRRSLGLGLALCRFIIEAHGGTMTLTDNVPHGSVFSFTLPIEEVKMNE
ncbi:MAG: DUF4118 domain-containing protein [Lachnospiraceae bacterium]|nr:DUF4118 domain-containing protein [Lachnospiraceae bacterium]